MDGRMLVLGILLFATFPLAVAAQAASNTSAAAEEHFGGPRVSRDQTRPVSHVPKQVVANCCRNQDSGPGAGTPGATECYSDKSCRTQSGYKCQALTGLTCYEWVNSDGLQRCAAC